MGIGLKTGTFGEVPVSKQAVEEVNQKFGNQSKIQTVLTYNVWVYYKTYSKQSLKFLNTILSNKGKQEDGEEKYSSCIEN